MQEITEYKTSIRTGGNTRLRKLSTELALARNILNLSCEVMWYDHSLQATIENDQVKLLWDLRIYSDYHLLRDLRLIRLYIFVSIANQAFPRERPKDIRMMLQLDLITDLT